MSEDFSADVVDAAEASRRARAERLLKGLVAEGRSHRDGHKKGADMTVDAVTHGVTVNWLATVFHMPAITVKQRLKDCPPLHRRANGYVYDLKLAVRYLVKPVVDIDQYLRTMNTEDLPSKLQKEYWSAKRSRLDFEKEAGHLWATEDFMTLTGKLFQLIRTRSRLWLDNLEKKTPVTPEQNAFLTAQIDELLRSLIDEIKEVAKSREALSVLAKFVIEEAKTEAAEAQAMTAIETDEEDDDDFDPLSLI